MFKNKCEECFFKKFHDNNVDFMHWMWEEHFDVIKEWQDKLKGIK